MEELRKCPFCGGEAKLKYCDLTNKWYAECGGDCEMRVSTFHFPTREEAIEVWSKRVEQEE